MSATDEKARRVDVGFSGGQMLALRMRREPYDALRAALGDDRAERWHEVKTEDSDVTLDLSQVVYVRLDTEQHKVGFQLDAIQVLGRLDLALLRLLRTRGHHPHFELAVIRFSRLGNNGGLWLTLAAAGAALHPTRRDTYLRAARAVAMTVVLNYVVKVLIRRARPLIEDLPPLSPTTSSLSYPSAHASTSFAGARVMSEALHPAPLYAVAVAICLSRPYLGIHYPSDVMAGAALGSVIGSHAP